MKCDSVSQRMGAVLIAGLLAAPICVQSSQGQTAAPARKIKVGVQVMTADQYKPAPGKYGGQIVQDVMGEPKSFNPITAAETSTTIFTTQMFQGLTDDDPFTGDVRPLLAEKWELAADGVTWTFHLRHDVCFNDGSKFTADDVVFTWNTLIYDLDSPTGKPRWPCSMRDIATFDGKPVKVEKVDDYTVRFTTPVKVAIWDQLVSQGILCKARYAKAAADGSFGGTMGTDSTPQDLVGTGPFILGQYARGDHVTLNANPNYWEKDSAGGKKPYLADLYFRIVRESNTMLLNFEQQQSDVYSLRSGKDVAELRPREKSENFTLYQLGPSQGTFFVAFNENQDAAHQGKIPDYEVKWFGDPRFRQAVSYAIDRQALIRNVLRNLGYALPAPFTVAPGPFHQDGFVPYPHDAEKAKALLAEMGLKNRDGSGILSDEQGHKLKFTINTNAGDEIREQTVDFIRKDLRDIGMDVNTLTLEFNLLVEKLDRTCDWECIVMGLTGGLDPHDGANVWKSSARLHLWWPRETKPSTDWEAKIDEIFAQGIQEMDKAKRKDLYRQWVQIAYDQQPLIFLTTTERVAALRNRFGNIFPSPIGGLLYRPQEIFVQVP